MVLTDPMVDPRGGALTVGLGMVPGMAVVPHFGEVDTDAHGEKLHRSVALAPDALPVVGVPARTALVHDGSGWRSAGAGEVAVFVNGARAPDGLGALPAAS
jgi:cyanophycinase